MEDGPLLNFYVDQQSQPVSSPFLCSLLHAVSFSTFNPADYTANSGARQETWEGDGNDPAEGTGKENNHRESVMF